MLKSLSVGCWLLTLVVLTGCAAGGKTKTRVNGEVLLDGKPLPEGEISLVVAGEVPETLTITGGKFSGDVTQGDKKVEIRAFREGKIPPTATIKEAPKENYVPAKYNSDSTLKAKVTSAGIEPAKFEIMSQ
jgi:hypothetical protein